TDHNVHEALKITTRSYLIKDGTVRTHGTPAEIVRDPIAIAEYLGTGFNERNYAPPLDPGPALPPAPTKVASPPAPAPTEPAPATLEFPGPAPQKLTPSQLILEQEKIQRLIEKLKTPEQAKAVEELVSKGLAAVPALLSALERRDAELRQAALDVLQKILKRPIPFDAFAPEAVRKQQLAALREVFERKAG
ncbi:MAG: hypothetical protein HYR84_06045, partial [Planctomycetes bacterium]|nr:hypothetical protein [Planctomycetota bacterium]